MITIDGSGGTGSGTIVRIAVALSTVLGEPLRMRNARTKRDKPGLRPQHVAAVAAAAEMCRAETEGLEVGATSFLFRPGSKPRGGEYRWEIGTAGSTTLLALTVLPLAARADGPVTARVGGGTCQDFAPPAWHLDRVLARVLSTSGVAFGLEVARPGYVPRGGGEIDLSVQPVEGPLRPIRMDDVGEVERVEGLSLSSHLGDAAVSDRMADACEERLARAGLEAAIERRYDTTARQAGACLAIRATTTKGCFLGADMAGAPGRRSEWIGRRVAEDLLGDLETGATVDRHVADMLVVWAAIAGGTSAWIAPEATGHLRTGLDLVRQFGARTRLEGRRVEVTGLGLETRPDQDAGFTSR